MIVVNLCLWFSSKSKSSNKNFVKVKRIVSNLIRYVGGLVEIKVFSIFCL